MVEWEGQQGQVGPSPWGGSERSLTSSIRIQPQHVMNAADINQTYGLATSVAEEWLTADITNLQQEAESLCNSVLNPGNIEMNTTLQPGQALKFSNEDEKLSVSANAFNVPNSNLLDIIISNNFYEQWELDSDAALSSGKTLNQYVESRSPVSLWGSPMDLDNLKMDDVFQVDKADLFQGPTLAELNANDESLFDSLDSFDLLLPSETKSNSNAKSSKPHTVTLSSSVILTDLHYAERNAKVSGDSFKLANVKVENQSELEFCENKNDEESFIRNSRTSKNQDSELKLTLNKKLISLPALIKPESPTELKLQTVPSSFNSANHLANSASASGAIQESNEAPLKIKQETEYSRQRNISESDNTCNLSSSLSNDEGFDSQGEISDHEDLYTSDGESGDDTIDEISPSWSLTNDKWIGNKKKKRYFWQYNIQAKGPKGPKLTLSGNPEDPHMMTDVTDPVFSTKCKVEGVKHAGKARRGDGNDLTPNPRKLYNIGLELQKLSSVINDLTPVNELPFNARPKSRKEKNKLASRACRLKKKAQHEANKLKFFGLQQEHRHLLNILAEAKKIVKEKIQEDELSDNDPCQRKIDTLFNKKAVTKVAGYTADFVNNVLERVAAGDPSGGLSRM